MSSTADSPYFSLSRRGRLEQPGHRVREPSYRGRFYPRSRANFTLASGALFTISYTYKR
ncbi:hypothetical protein SAMN04489745_3163 [Arthrobacter woluwensis]|uniref:Uncharacterized protein n=1 Tax=Arthrobacter woluwensis TaxID=156980 RepID=A0A1H4TGJ5_9MICC|nr:hypothetical protein SAMN04489745_3163 [Arthrobacter woluwensis]